MKIVRFEGGKVPNAGPRTLRNRLAKPLENGAELAHSGHPCGNRGTTFWADRFRKLRRILPDLEGRKNLRGLVLLWERTAC